MKTVFAASYLNQDTYLYLYLYVLFVSWGNEFRLQPYFSFLGYEAALLEVLSVVTTQSIAKFPGTFWSSFAFVLFSCDSVYYLKEGRRKTRNCYLPISAQSHLNSSCGTSVFVQNLCPGTPESLRVKKRLASPSENV